MWVKNPSRVPGRSQTVFTLDSTARTDRFSAATTRPCGVSFTRASASTMASTPKRRHRDVGGRPRGPGEQGQEGQRREHLAQLAADAGELGQQRHPPRREPVRHQAQHRDEGEGVAESDDGAGADGQWQRLGQRQQQLAAGHQRRARDDQHPRAVAVEQDPGGHLGAGVDDDLQDDERREDAGAGVEPLGGGRGRTRLASCGRVRRRCRPAAPSPRRSRHALGQSSRTDAPGGQSKSEHDIGVQFSQTSERVYSSVRCVRRGHVVISGLDRQLGGCSAWLSIGSASCPNSRESVSATFAPIASEVCSTRRVAEGRSAYYDDHHLTQLGTINELLRKGYTSAHIAEFLSSMRQGHDLAGHPRLQQAVFGPPASDADGRRRHRRRRRRGAAAGVLRAGRGRRRTADVGRPEHRRGGRSAPTSSCGTCRPSCGWPTASPISSTSWRSRWWSRLEQSLLDGDSGRVTPRGGRRRAAPRRHRLPDLGATGRHRPARGTPSQRYLHACADDGS